MPIVTAAITIVASGVFAAIVAYRLNATKEHVFFLRQKAEALYMAVEKYDRASSVHFIGYYGVLKNEISYNDVLDLQIKRGSNDDGSADSLDAATMLINVYFPALKPRLAAYETARENILKILADHKRAYKRGDTDGTPWFKPFHESLIELHKIATAFKQAILQEAVALAPVEQLWPRSWTIAGLRATASRMFRGL